MLVNSCNWYKQVEKRNLDLCGDFGVCLFVVGFWFVRVFLRGEVVVVVVFFWLVFFYLTEMAVCSPICMYVYLFVHFDGVLFSY